ncbi:MAG: hypothetical protein IKS48_06850 [Eubacterium sp.]|nr:hypothetical protein [Eubacterium sp.]
MKENEDETFSLGDLLDVYYRKKIYAKYDKSALQISSYAFFIRHMVRNSCVFMELDLNMG